MGDQKLTRRQRQILDFIADFNEANGFAPSYREIGEHLGLSSPATIYEHIQALIDKGFLRSTYNEKRSLELVKWPTNWAQAVELSLAGLITAGEPIEAVQDYETVSVPADLAVDPDNSFALKVKGDSMIDDGILDGDVVICQRINAAENGQMVVALIDNQYATLKRFYREGRRVRLQPANDNYQPIYPPTLTIQGVVRGVIRRY